VSDAEGQLKPVEQLFVEMADGLAGLKSDSERAALAQTLLGRAGVQLVPLLKQGTEAIEAQRKEARDLGAVMGEDLINTSAELTDTIARLGRVWAGMKLAVGEEVLPVVADLALTMFEFAKTLIGPVRKGINDVKKGMQFMAGVVRGLLSPFQRLDTALLFLSLTVLPAVLLAFQSVGFAAVVAAVKSAAAWLIATGPMLIAVVLLALIAAAILLVIEDLQKMGEGADSVSGTMIQGFTDLVDKVGGVGPAIAEMLATALKFWAEFFQDTLGLSDKFVDDIKKSADKFSEFFAVKKEVSITGRRRIAAGAGLLQQAGRTGTAVQATAGIASHVGGARTMINQPNMQTTVHIDASGSRADPQVIGGVVRREVEAAQEAIMRQARDAFAVGSGG